MNQQHIGIGIRPCFRDSASMEIFTVGRFYARLNAEGALSASLPSWRVPSNKDRAIAILRLNGFEVEDRT